MNETRSPFPFFSSSSMRRTEWRYGTFTSDVPCSTSSARAKQLRLIGDRNQREKSAVTQAPDTDAIGVDVVERLEIGGRHPGVLCVLAADVHVDALAPVASVSDAATIVR